MASKFDDALTYAIAVGFAAACIVFAGYKVIILRHMENPPADLGLNFPPPKRKMITDDSIRVDPIQTQSTTSGEQDPAAARVLQPYTSDAPAESYRLMAVIDGVAFVEIKTFRGKEIRPVSLGANLPGAGPVSIIERTGGRWILVAGDVRLVAER